ncbi:hypothetical protein WJX77_009672 [Trebouxia sp. C0004]
MLKSEQGPLAALSTASYEEANLTPSRPKVLPKAPMQPLSRSCQARLAAAWSTMPVTGGEECDMFKEFVVSKEDLQSPRSSPVNAGADCDCDPDLGSQLSPKLGSQSSPAVTTVCNGLTAGMDLTCLVDESGQVNISAPPLSPSVDGSDSHSPTSSFTFAGKAHEVKPTLAKHAQHAQWTNHGGGFACCCYRCKDSVV